jgi:hypothetical protein
LTCEKFAEWKEANDPEYQAEGYIDKLINQISDSYKLTHFII